MIIGIGIDIIEIKRVSKAIDNPAFMKRVYTIKEQDYLKSRKNNPGTAAGYFAAKEAASKALGTGFRGIKWTEIEISCDEMGKPLVGFLGKAGELFRKLGGKDALVSISHSQDNAIAQVIIF